MLPAGETFVSLGLPPRHPLSPVSPRTKAVMPSAGLGCKDVPVKHLLGAIPVSTAAVPWPRDTVPGHWHLLLLQWCCWGGTAMIVAPVSQEPSELVLGSCSGRKLKTGRRKSLASRGHSTDSAAPSHASASRKGASALRRQM